MNTWGELYGPAMTITDETQAQTYFEKLVKGTMEETAYSLEDAERIVRHNLGYYAGYYDNETRERVERLFQCEHPIFGAIKEKGAPTAREAFEAGIKMGEQGYQK